MSRLSVISDASALIGLAQIELLDHLALLFEQCVIPPAVAVEIAPTVVRPDWIGVRTPSGPIPRQVEEAALGRGETEAIALALDLDG